MNIDEFIKGWLVGDFNPALIKSKDIEVGIKYYKAGDYESKHVHNLVTEYTIIVSGTVKMNDIEYSDKSIVVVNPTEPTDFYCITDAITLVIKTPSIPTDKHICE